MGLYDIGTQSQVQETLTPAEAFAAIILTVVATDGYFSIAQGRVSSSVLSRMKLFREYSDEQIDIMFDKLLNILQQDGINTLFNIARESLTLNLREAAFATATDLLFADCVATQEEQDFLKDLYQALGIATDIGLQIIQVMIIKNRG